MNVSRFRPVRVLPVLRQLALAAMLLVQATIVASPLFEPHTTGAPVTHVEEPGARHVDMHNEATCVVCSVRAMHVVLASPAVAITTVLDAGITPSTEVPRLSLHAALALYPSRAPPPLS
jgi:hypothetical protein